MTRAVAIGIDQALIADYVESARNRVVTRKQTKISGEQKATNGRISKKSDV
jgi:hypothetical protein